ncbi:MAG: ATP-dependent Clp protease ATP-binding subunit [Paludibacteraceae bacterium]|nr:ATP-dependent Clp protease ATP-binding subunit [Paludibacteraceae bacterium]
MHRNQNSAVVKTELINIAISFAAEYSSDAVYPAHLFKAVLHKEAGLVPFLERDLDKDYYYLQEWADVQMSLAPRAVRPTTDLQLSEESVDVLDEAVVYQKRFSLEECDAVCLLASLVTPGVGFSFDALKTLPLTAAEICEKMGTTNNNAAQTSVGTMRALSVIPGSQQNAKTGNNLQKYCINKTAEAESGKLSPVIGFEDEISTIYEILGRRTKSNLLITGESGVGKTSLVNAFAIEISKGNVPTFLKGSVIYEVDLATLGADASYKGEVEDRFKKILNEVKENKNAILLIESIDKLFDKQGSLYGASSILKQELSRGNVLLLCTSSIDGYTKNIETDKEFVTKIEKISIDEPNAEDCLDILKGSIQAYEKFHGLTIEEDVMVEAIRLAKRYLTEKALPDSAFDLIDRSMAFVKTMNDMSEETEKHTALEISDLSSVVAKQTGIPMGKVQSGERDRLINGESTLKKRVVGQDHAVKTVLDSVFESRSGLNKKGQPMGSFFFLGPTGTGKTELSKALAEFLFEDESSLIRFDMSEFKEEHSVALLYGAPPGYVGYEEGGLLVNKIRQKPYSVVLFDEIEKAHKSVFDLFLQILDEGKLHDRLGRVGDFSNALILFTSNIGSQFIVDAFNEGRIPENNELMDIMQGHFRPEFLARLTEIVPFSPIMPEGVVKIFDIHLNGLLKLLEEQNIKLIMTDEVKKEIAMKGYNQQYGARPLIGIIRKELRHPLSKLIISGKVQSGDTVQVNIINDKIEFTVKK